MILTIFEDGEIKQFDREFNQDDLYSIDAGILTVIQFNTTTGKFEGLQPDGSWKEV